MEQNCNLCLRIGAHCAFVVLSDLCYMNLERHIMCASVLILLLGESNIFEELRQGVTIRKNYKVWCKNDDCLLTGVPTVAIHLTHTVGAKYYTRLVPGTGVIAERSGPWLSQRCQMAPEDFNKRREDGSQQRFISACFSQDSVLQQFLGIQFLGKAASWAGPSTLIF